MGAHCRQKSEEMFKSHHVISGQVSRSLSGGWSVAECERSSQGQNRDTGVSYSLPKPDLHTSQRKVKNTFVSLLKVGVNCEKTH